MRENQFSNDKIFFYPERLNQVLDGRTAKPVVYELSLSGSCNCACKYCCCKYFHNGEMLTKGQIESIVKEVASNHGKAVTLTGGGEPMMNPHFAYCIRQFAAAGISVGVITNGLLFDEDRADAVARHASFCRISLDTVEAGLYKKLRGTSLDLASLADSLKMLAERKKRYESELLIGTQIVYVNQSDDEIVRTILFCRDCGVDFVQIRPVDNITGESMTPPYEFYQSKRDFLLRLASYNTDQFSVIINENKFQEYEDQNVGKPYQRCLGGNFTAAIGHDMLVYFCCANIGNPVFSLGSLEADSLSRILKSEKRKEIIEHPERDFCQMQCRNHKINKILWELQQMPREQANMEIQWRQNGARPVHCEFL